MKFFEKKSKDITSPTEVDNSEPVKNFLFLLSIIITTPFIFIYSLLRGRIRHPVLIVGFLLLIVYGFYRCSLSTTISKRDIKTKIIQQTLEELTPEEKEELRKEISTLREETDIQNIPQPLYPLIDVPLDKLSINYLMFMMQSGYIKPDGTGSEFILDSYMHSNHKLLREKSWEALHNIDSDAARRVMANYQKEVEENRYKGKPDMGTIGNLKNDIQDKFKSGIQEIQNKTSH